MPPAKEVHTDYPLIDADPHFSRVVRYFRLSDYATWAFVTAAVPAFQKWHETVDPATAVKTTKRYSVPARVPFGLGTWVGFVGGFLIAYQNSSMRFWGWSENAREEKLDFEELSQRAREGKPLYGSSHQPAWIQEVAYKTSAFSQAKFAAIPMMNFVQHQHHGTDPAKYGVKRVEDTTEQ